MLLSVRKRTVTDCQELSFVEENIPLVVDGLLIFLRHAEGVKRIGLHTHHAKEAASHIHIIFFGLSLDRLTGDFGAAGGNDTA